MSELMELTGRLDMTGRVSFSGGRLPWAYTIVEIRQATIGGVGVIPDGYGHHRWPPKLLEYAHLGVPVVCSRLPAIEAYFRPDALAYATPGDPADMAVQIDRLLRDPQPARRQAHRPAEIAERLAWRHMRLDYLSALGLRAKSEDDAQSAVTGLALGKGASQEPPL